MKLYEIVFSPTGGTQRAADMLAKGIGGDAQTIDLSDVNFGGASLTADDAAVIAVPSFGGRVPAVAVERLGKIAGNGAKAVLLCVYGNRAYEDTLAELADAAKAAGFAVVAAVAAIAEHSIARQFASGRPDADDERTLAAYGEQIRRKIDAGDMHEPEIPGNRPYKKGGGAPMTPKADKNCVGCGVCARKCPVGAIDRADPAKVDGKACIACMRCVSVCPHGARKVSGVMLAAVGAMLSKACAGRKECELHI